MTTPLKVRKTRQHHSILLPEIQNPLIDWVQAVTQGYGYEVTIKIEINCPITGVKTEAIIQNG